MNHVVMKKRLGMTILFLVFLIMGWGAGMTVSHADQTAVVAAAAPDYSSGAHSVISVEPVGGPRTTRNELAPTLTSDVTVDSHGRYFYRMERFMMDNIAKFDIDAPDVPIWQFTTNDPAENLSSNPSALIFVDDAKAYLLRYGAAKVWIVNPSASVEAEFKIGELDLSAYGDEDGIPEMISGVIAGDRLFVAMQRLNRNNNWIPERAYVAVFDVASDTEIVTGRDAEEGLNGIPLDIKNPAAVVYLAQNDVIYIQGSGGYESEWSGTPADYSGGIIRLNPDTYETAMVVDDGDDDDHPYGNISGLAVVSATKGYLVGYAGWGDNTLYPFNPSTGEVGAPIEGLSNKSISDINSAFYADRNGMLWVSNQTDAEVVILNTVTDLIDERVDTVFNPMRVVFCETGDASDSPEDSDGDDSSTCFIGSLLH